MSPASAFRSFLRSSSLVQRACVTFPVAVPKHHHFTPHRGRRHPGAHPHFRALWTRPVGSKKKSRAHGLAEPGPGSTGGNLAFLPHTIRQGCQLPKMFSKCSIKRDTLMGGCGSLCGERAFPGSEFQQSASEQLLDPAPPSERLGIMLSVNLRSGKVGAQKVIWSVAAWPYTNSRLPPLLASRLLFS